GEASLLAPKPETRSLEKPARAEVFEDPFADADAAVEFEDGLERSPSSVFTPQEKSEGVERPIVAPEPPKVRPIAPQLLARAPDGQLPVRPPKGTKLPETTGAKATDQTPTRSTERPEHPTERKVEPQPRPAEPAPVEQSVRAVKPRPTELSSNPNSTVDSS